MRTTLLVLAWLSAAASGLSAQADSTGAFDPAQLARPEVARFLDYFTGPARDRMSQWLARGTQYRGTIERRLAKEGLPTEFAFLPVIESGFSNSATSRAGAAGMWQLIPETARGLGLRVDNWIDERRNPARATDAAVRHIRDLTKTFGSPLLAAAAYNGGAGRVSRSLGRLPQGDDAGEDAFFTLADRRMLPKETRDYVPELLAAAAIGRDPARYGFTVDSSATPAFDSIRIDRPIRLAAAEAALGLNRTSLRTMNPELIRGVTPPDGSWLKVPSGRGVDLAGILGRLPSVTMPMTGPGAPELGLLIRVKRGETLEDIARDHGISEATLRRVNALPVWLRIRPGQALRLPATEPR